MDNADAAPVGKRERNKAEKQRRIRDAARALFESQGYERTTTAEISQQAGIGTGTLYLYVNSKEELLVEVFEEEVVQAWNTALARVDPASPILDQLLDAFTHVAEFHIRDPELGRAYFKELAFLPRDTVAPTIDFMRSYYDQLAALLTTARDDGRLRADVDVEILARNLFALWFHTMMLTFAGYVRKGDIRRRLKASFGTALLGVTTEDVAAH